jgi:hypothetical protein
MTTYVFGAGASRDAGYPLANELGKRLLEWAQQTNDNSELHGAGIRDLFDLYGSLDNLEQILSELDECPAGSRVASLTPAQRGLFDVHVRLGISEVFRSLRRKPAPFYVRLAREKARPGDVVITFNYDVACERELKRAGLWEISDGYGFHLEGIPVPPSQVSILKLHGSVNWLEVAFGGRRGLFQGSLNAFGSRPAIPAGEFEFFGYSSESRDPEAPLERFGALPAIITPTLKKRFYEQTPAGRELEPFWENLWAQARHALEASEKIVMIGYSMAAADEKARSLLLSSPNRHVNLEVFCGGRTKPISDEFLARGYSQVRTLGNCRCDDYLATP